MSNDPTGAVRVTTSSRSVTVAEAPTDEPAPAPDDPSEPAPEPDDDNGEPDA